ncbi:c-type cytochrome biogenesis protein CcsB [Wenjunlia tyrosinilytica]|uniref:C-type cytochrome biogenesis protein CcsB n=1 Tax=Wenjunlia tyrosinilytica TaxID=1544741 RepID=A0A917ZQL5_9ACTN|nr:c-type cytochrome biogenesis protein CcsB [Wenjunlia tyrosinilytica]GGO89740.1 c-type cytochrome biogenesis protein CcsB [Wenjunlia tyrosinilytica]
MFIAAEANENLAHISNVLMYSAMAVYTLSFLAHCAEWVFGGRSRIAVQSAAIAARREEPAGERAVTVQVRRSGAGTATLSRPKVVTKQPDRPCEDGPGAAGEDEQADLLGRMAVSLMVLGFLLHFGSVLCRGISVQRPPWGNMYEFSTTFALVAVGTYLVLLASKLRVRWLGLPVVTAVLLDLGIAITKLYTESDQLVPALHSYWLWIHVTTAILSGAALYLGAVTAVLYLFKDGYETRIAQGEPGGRLTTVWRRLPAAASLDKFSYRINAIIFPLYTFAIIAGAIWAEGAWGRYWGWDPKETWSFITWVGYAAYLHARATAGWKGRKAAYLALIAFACFLFNYYGVNLFITGKHSYAGV